jgi:hypothetical protein
MLLMLVEYSRRIWEGSYTSRRKRALYVLRTAPSRGAKTSESKTATPAPRSKGLKAVISPKTCCAAQKTPIYNSMVTTAEER